MSLTVDQIIAEYDITTEGVAPLKPTNGLKALDPSAALKMVCCNRSHLPILQHVFVKDGWAEATDLDVGLRIRYDLPDGFYQHIGKRLMPSADAETAADWAEEWPVIPMGQTRIATVNLAELSRKLAIGARFVSAPETRELLSGVLIRSQAGQRTEIIATDSHRAWRSYLDSYVPTTEDACGLIVPFPAKIAKLLLALSEGSPETTTIAVEGCEPSTCGDKDEGTRYNGAIFRSDYGSLYARLIDGQFPNTKKVIPQTAGYRIEVDTAALRLAASRIAAVSERNDDCLKIGVCFARRDRLALTCKAPDGGVYHECIPAAARMLDPDIKPEFGEFLLQMPMWIVDSKDEDYEFIHSVAFGVNAHYLHQAAQSIGHVQTTLTITAGTFGYSLPGMCPVVMGGAGGTSEKPVKANLVRVGRREVLTAPNAPAWRVTAAEYDALEPDASKLIGAWTIKAERWDRDRQLVPVGSNARLSTYRLVFTPEGKPRVEDVETLEIHHYTNGEGIWRGPIRSYHPVAVLTALAEGKPVPQKVLKEYAWAFKEPEDAVSLKELKVA